LKPWVPLKRTILELPGFERNFAAGCWCHEELQIRGKIMHEVKVYDSDGKLKKVIPVKTLNQREDRKVEFPDMFRKNKRNPKPATGDSKPSQP
jgi:hypothetical protein